MLAPQPKHEPDPALPQKAGGPSAALCWCALALAMFFPAGMAWIYFVVLSQPAAGDGRPAAGALPAYLASKMVQFSFPLVWVASFERYRLRPAVPSCKGLAVGVAFSLLVAGLILSVYYGWLAGSGILAETSGKIRAKLLQFHADTPPRYLVLALFIAGIHSLLEEYYWRWFVFGELRQRLTVAVAITLSSLAFMAHHVIVLGVYFPGHLVTAALPFSLAVATGGAVWAWLYQRTGNIYSSWISHLLIDAVILAVGYHMVFIVRPANP